MLYIISYDLIAASADKYQALYDELERLGAVRVLWSQWAVRLTNTSPSALRDHFRGFVGANDRILVTAPGSNWSSWRALVDLNDV